MPSKSGSKSTKDDKSIPREGLAGRIEQAVYDYVYDTFGKSEAEDPSWYTPDLAKYVADYLASGKYEPKHKIRYSME